MTLNYNNFNNVVFDLGGVLLNISPQHCLKQFQKFLDISSFGDIEERVKSKIFDRIETDDLSEAEFYSAIRNIAPNTISDSTIEKAWQSMLIDFFQDSIQTLKKISEHKRVFLLSNTNIIHLRYFSQLYSKAYGGDDFNTLFEKAYYSHEVKHRKPGKDIFYHVLKDANIKAEETLFIDDMPENIQAAKEVGLNTLHYKQSERNLSEYFDV